MKEEEAVEWEQLTMTIDWEEMMKENEANILPCDERTPSEGGWQWLNKRVY